MTVTSKAAVSVMVPELSVSVAPVRRRVLLVSPASRKKEVPVVTHQLLLRTLVAAVRLLLLVLMHVTYLVPRFLHLVLALLLLVHLPFPVGISRRLLSTYLP